jgi:hypothetical protein
MAQFLASSAGKALMTMAANSKGSQTPQPGQPAQLLAPVTPQAKPTGYQAPQFLNLFSGGKLQNNINQTQQNIEILKKLFGG